MQGTGTRPKVVVTGGARGVVGHAGARLLTDLADKTGLSRGFVQALGLDRVRRPAHEPGRVAVDLAVLMADGGEAIADLAVLRQQPALFGPVASDPTAWRVLDSIDIAALTRLRAARAAARELAWFQLLETHRRLPATTVLGQVLPGFVLDIDATIVLTHSEKESAAATWKHSIGFHQLLCFLDATGEALAGMLRPGNAGSNTAADHVTVLGRALQQIPEPCRYGTPILIRSDSAGSSHEFLAHIRGLRDGADLVELTDLLDPGLLASFPSGARLICRRERPHPGAQLSLFDQINGMRHQVFVTDTPHGGGSIQFLEVRHRCHARVEDRICTGKTTGFGRFPSRVFAINQAWLELALTGIDLLCWTQHLLLDGPLAAAEPKRLRYRLLHVAAKLTPTARNTTLRIAAGWPWADDLVKAFRRLAELPEPVT